MNETANRIKELRSRRGYSQEELAERSGLSLRTIQRIENGETEPRGDSLTRLAAAFDVTVDDLADWGLVEDKMTIMVMNLSALSFLFFPLLGILVPLIIWIFKKDKVKGINDAARSLLNFQITWAIVLFVGWLPVSYLLHILIKSDFILPQYAIVMYVYNLIVIGVNSVRAGRGKKVVYRPAIPFIRK
jgi:transcriptional regulator with XRE-family HTH domain